MDIYSIYKATNLLNGKCYIGFDSNWPKRQEKHFHWAFYITLKKHKEYYYSIHKALREFGKDFFTWEIIYQSQDSKHCLKVMEPYFIKEYDSFQNGYNMTSGGDGRMVPHTPETIIKMKQRIPWNKGIKTGPQSLERIEKTKKALTGKIRGPYKGNLEYSSSWQVLHIPK